ncbi:hypothetical protein D7Z26_27005 [Cohnella endophytica]|uniref:Uncharacterized protein n=1 Tax=Cohnella endophytica TaxID=2419778 RepID=A0A494X8T3_9BACL|nr:hypothetical protein [Cohnella endophytica]RKP44063.1 hypothetical protein D7Z26_27005 [Cohnella endophytica]
MRNQNQIISISSDHLIYKDHTGIDQKINFQTCKANYSLFLQSMNSLSQEEWIETKFRSRCVALRKTKKKKLILEFFTEPRTIFEFKISFFKRASKEYFEVLTKLYDFGWTTRDMN